MQSETVWTFETPRFRIELNVRPSDCDPDDHLDAAEALAVRRGRAAWFDASVVVSIRADIGTCVREWHPIAADHLGACAYDTVADFRTGHYGNRGDYFPSMVREACSAARKALAQWTSIPMREA